MMEITKHDIYGWEAAIRGMRNPMNSWGRSDSGNGCVSEGLCCKCPMNAEWCGNRQEYTVGKNDIDLMIKLAKAGPVHAKYRRMITVTADILAPLYWWKEFDTYKVGTVANSCSTMHKIHEKKFELADFSHEHLINHDSEKLEWGVTIPYSLLNHIVCSLNECRQKYIETNDKIFWWQMIQLLPSSYNQKRTVMLNYEVLANIYRQRKDHKLDEWRDFCNWIESLPYSLEIIMKKEVNEIG